MDFIIKLLGLDSKARGFLIGYRTHIAMAGVILFNLGPVLIGMGTAVNDLAGSVTVLLQFVDGKLPLLAAWAQAKAQLLLIKPIFVQIVGHATAVAGALGLSFFKAGIDRNHAEQIAAHADTMTAVAACVPTSTAPEVKP